MTMRIRCRIHYVTKNILVETELGRVAAELDTLVKNQAG